MQTNETQPQQGQPHLQHQRLLQPLATVHRKFRVDVPGEHLGFTPPPCPVHIKFRPLGTGWTVVVHTPPGRPPAAARWLETFSPISSHITPGLSPSVLRANFEGIPDPWRSFLGAVVVEYLEVAVDGSASLFIADSPEKVETFVATLRANEPLARSRLMNTDTARPLLTARQKEIICLAVALGYYEVPHKLYLRTLAKKAGISVGAVSELLRRGEALIVANYIDAISAAKWHNPPRPVVPT